jgi:hypothetical protein
MRKNKIIDHRAAFPESDRSEFFGKISKCRLHLGPSDHVPGQRSSIIKQCIDQHAKHHLNDECNQEDLER